MTAPRVLIRDSAPETDVRSAPVRLGGAWGLLVPTGLAFLLVGGADLALVWYPLGFGSAEWEFGSVTSMLNGLPVLVMGLAFLGMAAVASGRRWAGRGIAAVLALLAVAVVLMAALYATTVPIALKAVPNEQVALGLKKAIAKTTVQAAVYPVLLVWLAIATWRRSGQ
ncbi:MAG TPA: hypothetical protein VFQ76_10965 [Longimicrobiaceae bacterium]|nr:hypothetical protein [Longimicrobiaceae bacterium]